MDSADLEVWRANVSENILAATLERNDAPGDQIKKFALTTVTAMKTFHWISPTEKMNLMLLLHGSEAKNLRHKMLTLVVEYCKVRSSLKGRSEKKHHRVNSSFNMDAEVISF